MWTKKFSACLFSILAAFFITSCSLIKELKPTTFAIGATEIGYNTNLTADELIKMAVKEGYSESEVRQKIKGTSWAKSKNIESAIKKYYSNIRNLPSNFKEAASSEGYKTDISAEELVVLAKAEGYSKSEVLNSIKGSPWEKSNLVSNAIEKYYTNNEDISAVLKGLKSSDEIRQSNLKGTIKTAAGNMKDLQNSLLKSLGYSEDEESVETEDSSSIADESSAKLSSSQSKISSSDKDESSSLSSESSQNLVSLTSNSDKNVQTEIVNSVEESFIDSSKKEESFVFTSDDDSSFYKGEKLEVDITKSGSEILYNFKYTDRTKRIISESQTYKVSGKNKNLVNCDYKYHKTKITSKEDSETFSNMDYEIIKRYDAALKRHGYTTQNPMYK